jgi:hypothetical protein
VQRVIRYIFYGECQIDELVYYVRPADRVDFLCADML